MASSKNYLAIFGLLLGAVCWGVVWYPYRLMQEAGVSGVASSFYTYLIASVIGAVLFVRDWRNVFKQTKSRPVRIDQLKTMILLALVAGWTNLSYVLAVIDGEVMRVMLLFYLSPLWTLIFAHFLLKEHVDARGLLTIGLSLLGAFVMLTDAFGDGGTWMPLPQNTAEWLAMSAGIGFALSNVISRKTSNLNLATKSMSIWLGVMFMALIFTSFQATPLPMPDVFSASNWMIMVLIAIILIVATVIVQYGITKISASRASVVFLFELVVAAIASYYLAHETMQVHEWIGGALIVLAAFYSALAEDSRT